MKYECPCGYVYDPALGDPENGVAPGTAWKFRSRRWMCTCGKARTKIRIFPQQRRETSVFGAEIFVDF